MHKWGIIGEGNEVEKFATALKMHKKSRLHSLSCPQTAQGKRLTKKYGIKNYHQEYSNLIIDPAITHVFIASALPVRASLARACMKYGKHVLCTPPISTDIEELKKTLDMSRKQDVLLVEGMLSCFLPSMQRCLEIVEKGNIGEIMHLHASACDQISFNPELPFFAEEQGGIFNHMGIYPLFLSCLLLGAPQEMKGYIQQGITGVDESYCLLFRYAKNQIATLLSSRHMDSAHEALVLGKHARMHLHAPFYDQTHVSLYSKKGRIGLMKFHFLGNSYYYAIEAMHHCASAAQYEAKQWSHAHSLLLAETIDRCRKEVLIYKESETPPSPPPPYPA